MISSTFSGTDVSPKKRVNRIYGQKCRQKINADNTPVRLALKSNKTARLFSILKYSAVAASVALLIGAGCFLLLNDEERHDLNKIAQSLQTEIPQDIKEVTLVVSDQRR